jgi:hypothetical protein
MRKFIICGVLAAFSGICFAPIKDQGDLKTTPERSQQQLSQEQRLQTVQGEIGQVPQDTTIDHVDREMSDSTAKDNLQSVNKTMESDRAKKILIAEENNLRKKKSGPWGMALWGLGFLVVGVLAALGFKQYANRFVPEPPDQFKKNAKW